MTTNKIRNILIIFTIGFLFLALDFYISTGINYPKTYKTDDTIIGEFQYYNINTYYGAHCTFRNETGHPVTNVKNTDGSIHSAKADEAIFVDDVFLDPIRIDIFNDVIGLLLMAFACYKLSSKKRVFRLAYMLIFLTIGLKLALSILPFILNGMTLCTTAMAFGISYTLAIIIGTYFSVKGFLLLADNVCCRAERKWINTAWFVHAVLSILVLLLTWLDLVGLLNFFVAVHFATILFIGIQLMRVEEFIARNINGDQEE